MNDNDEIDDGEDDHNNYDDLALQNKYYHPVIRFRIAHK